MNSVTVLKTIDRLGLTASAKRFKQLLIRIRLWPKTGIGYSHRIRAYKLLSGRGLEIGALNCPAIVPVGCIVQYCDAHSKEDSARLFPEIESRSLVNVAYLVNLDEEKLSSKVKPPYDFVIMNHVIEHVANPIAVLQELCAVVRPGGLVIVSAPDKEFTFDKPRLLTPFKHLLDEYHDSISYVDDDHYLDFIRYTSPSIYNSGDSELMANALKSARLRREHAHVWDTDSFLEFLKESINFFELNVAIEFTSPAKDNNFECFVVLKKLQSQKLNLKHH